jgi:hypothetical protein
VSRHGELLPRKYCQTAFVHRRRQYNFISNWLNYRGQDSRKSTFERGRLKGSELREMQWNNLSDE